MSHQHQLTDSTSNGDEGHDSLIRRSWHAMSDLFQPFSRSALDKLPKAQRPRRYTRADEIPDVEATDDDGQMPTVRDYHSITVPPQVRVPKKVPTPVRVESKVWFANERSTYRLSLFPTHLSVVVVFSPCHIPIGLSVGLDPRLDSEYSLYGFLAWVSYLNMAILIGTLSVALFNASKDPIARKFAYVYSAISVGILVRTSLLFLLILPQL
jgi:hypothetical protein